MFQFLDDPAGQASSAVGGVGPDPPQTPSGGTPKLGRLLVVPAERAARDRLAAFEEQEQDAAVRCRELLVG